MIKIHILGLATFWFITEKPSEIQTESDPEILIHKLSSQDVKSRADSQNRLIDLGYKAKKSIEKGLHSTDPEISSRCKEIWKIIQYKTPEENPKLEVILKNLNENSDLNKISWEEQVDARGPHVLLWIAPFINKLPSDRIQDFLFPLLNHRQFIEFAIKNKAISTDVLKIYKPCTPQLGKELFNQKFIEVMLYMNPECLPPYLELDSLPNSENAKLILGCDKLLDKMNSINLSLMKKVLPFIASDTIEAKKMTLHQMDANAFVENAYYSGQFLGLVEELGLLNEISHLRFPKNIETCRETVNNFQNGRIYSMDEFIFNNNDDDNPEALYYYEKFLVNGNKDRQRFFNYLYSSSNNFLAMNYGESDKLDAYLRNIPPSAKEEFHKYLLESLRGKINAREHLDIALSQSINSLPLLFEKALISKNDKDVDALCATVPVDIFWVKWFCLQSKYAEFKISTKFILAWIKSLDINNSNVSELLAERIVLRQ